MSYQYIIVSRPQKGVCSIQLNRPKQLNALSKELIGELLAALRSGDSDDSVKVFVLTGQEGMFAAGADIKQFLSGKAHIGKPAEASLDGGFCKQMLAISKPIMAAVDGGAYGGGFEVLLSCDMVYATKSSKLGLPEVKLGLLPGQSGTQRLTRIVGVKRASEMILMGKTISSQEAMSLGIINKVYETHEELMTSVFRTAGLLAESSPKALKNIKSLINYSENTLLSDGLDREYRLFQDLLQDEDQHEGIRAFLEKRKPNWSKL